MEFILDEGNTPIRWPVGRECLNYTHLNYKTSNKLQTNRAIVLLSSSLLLSYVERTRETERERERERTFEQVPVIFSNRRHDAALGIEIDGRDELNSSRDISTGVPYE